MKKTVALLMALLMLSLCTVNVFAAGNFVNSPSVADTGVEVIGVTDEDGEPIEGWAKVVVTEYSQKEELSEEKQEALEEAYVEIKSADDLVELCPELAEVLKELDIPAEDLAASTLFDISFYQENQDPYEGYLQLEMKAELLDNFVSLLSYQDGWQIVRGVKVSQGRNGMKTLTFRVSVKDLGAFAILVRVSHEAPGTGGASHGWLYIVLAGSAVVALSLILVVTRRKPEEKKS